jgi:hypothetical protein
MATEIISNALVLAGGYNLSGVMNAVTLSEGAEHKDATVLESTGRVRKPGLTSATARLEGFFEGVAEGGLAAGLALTDIPFSVVHKNVENEVAYLFKALWAEMVPMGGAVGDMARMSLTAESSSGAVAAPVAGALRRSVIRGILGTHQTAAIATGTSTPFQLGAVSATQYLYAALHVYGASDADTLDVVLESDALATFLSPTTQLSFAQKTGIGSEWATPIVGAPITDEWWRVKYTIGGTLPSFAFAVTFGIL